MPSFNNTKAFIDEINECSRKGDTKKKYLGKSGFMLILPKLLWRKRRKNNPRLYENLEDPPLLRRFRALLRRELPARPNLHNDLSAVYIPKLRLGPVGLGLGRPRFVIAPA